MATKKLKGYLRLYSNNGDSVFGKFTDTYTKHFTSKKLLLEDITGPFYDTMYDFLEACDYRTQAEFLKDAKQQVPDLWSDSDIIVECATGTIIEPLSFGLDKVLTEVVDILWEEVADKREAELQQTLVRKKQLENQLADAKKTVAYLTAELGKLP